MPAPTDVEHDEEVAAEDRAAQVAAPATRTAVNQKSEWNGSNCERDKRALLLGDQRAAERCEARAEGEEDELVAAQV